MGFTDRLQKYIVSACWAAYWGFMFFGMTSYAAAVPDDLGWGATVLESSFGLLRFAFFIVSALLVASFFDLWHTDNVVEAWAEFTQTDLLTAKKRNFMLMYLVIVSVTVLLDVIKIAAMPNL